MPAEPGAAINFAKNFEQLGIIGVLVCVILALIWFIKILKKESTETSEKISKLHAAHVEDIKADYNNRIQSLKEDIQEDIIETKEKLKIVEDFKLYLINATESSKEVSDILKEIKLYLDRDRMINEMRFQELQSRERRQVNPENSSFYVDRSYSDSREEDFDYDPRPPRF